VSRPSHHPPSRLESRDDPMVCVIVFETDGSFGFMPASEHDGDVGAIIYELDPFIV
jgi:hypothetical protein